MAAKKRRTKRKISAAHLKALQAGLARWKRGTGKTKRTRSVSSRGSATKKRRTRVTVSVSNPRRRVARRHWWRLLIKRGRRIDCAVGQGTHGAVKQKAQSYANRTGNEVKICGPYANRDAAVAACQ